MGKIKECFVIAPIGVEGSDERKRSDIVLKHIIKPVSEDLGYTVIRADEISQPGSITLQVLGKIIDSSLVIADLSFHNPNVFYELAVRHALEKPVIHLIEAGQKIPFDVADLRAIQMELDLEGAEKTKEMLLAQIQQIESGNFGETPIKVAGILKKLEESKTEDKQILGQILESISSMQFELRNALARSMTPIPVTTPSYAIWDRPVTPEAKWDLYTKTPRFWIGEPNTRKLIPDAIRAFTSRILQLMHERQITFDDAYAIAMNEEDGWTGGD